jgi:hypothetical protein
LIGVLSPVEGSLVGLDIGEGKGGKKLFGFRILARQVLQQTLELKLRRTPVINCDRIKWKRAKKIE